MKMRPGTALGDVMELAANTAINGCSTLTMLEEMGKL
jgi:hypothetical protein